MPRECTIVMYHYVRDLSLSRYPEINALETSEFSYQVEHLSNNYTFVTVERLLEALHEGASLPENAALLTFDDGFVDHYETVYAHG